MRAIHIPFNSLQEDELHGIFKTHLAFYTPLMFKTTRNTWNYHKEVRITGVTLLRLLTIGLFFTLIIISLFGL